MNRDDHDVTSSLHFPHPVSDLGGALRFERSGTKSMLGRFTVAAQLHGIPLDAIPQEGITTRLPASTVATAGRCAWSASRPAPTARSPAPDCASSVSADPW